MRETKENTVHKVSDNKINQYSAVNENTRNYPDHSARPLVNIKRGEKSGEKLGEKPTYTRSYSFCGYTLEMQKREVSCLG